MSLPTQSQVEAQNNNESNLSLSNAPVAPLSSTSEQASQQNFDKPREKPKQPFNNQQSMV